MKKYEKTLAEFIERHGTDYEVQKQGFDTEQEVNNALNDLMLVATAAIEEAVQLLAYNGRYYEANSLNSDLDRLKE